MTAQLLNLPINVPWCQVAVSESMMDVRLGAHQFPAPWRSSLAIDAYEPPAAELPEELSHLTVTYLKVTCSITGYQPNAEETSDGYADLDDGSSDFRLIFEEYLACYGVLLNVTVLPLQQRIQVRRPMIGGSDLSIYPHIVGFEPKVRDLYQAATETGEVLTASNSKVSTDKTLAHSENSETGISLERAVTVGTQPAGGSAKAGLTHKWGETNQDSRSVQTDASRERRETQGTTTQLSQMYNILTGYHQGTNRATFLMLPRPHILPPTDYRTFVQGLRVIEGIQEFMLIVTRPKDVEGLCVEANLDLGHFSEDVNLTVPEADYDERVVRVTWGPISVTNRWGARETKRIDGALVVNQINADEYELDPRNGQGPVDETPLPGDDANGTTGGNAAYPALPALEEYTYGIEDPNRLVISGLIRSEAFGTTTFHRRYSIHLRKAKLASGATRADVADLLVTRRSLSVCFRSAKPCPQVVDLTGPASPENAGVLAAGPASRESIVHERKIRMNPTMLSRSAVRESRAPATAELLRQVQHALATSWRQPMRYPPGTVGFLDSDYFRDRLTAILPAEQLARPVAKLEGLPPAVVRALGEMSVGEAAGLDLTRLARLLGLSMSEAVDVRRTLLGSRPRRTEEAAADT